MIHIDSNGVDEILLCDIAFDKCIHNLVGPLRRGSHILPDSGSNIRPWLSQLAASPHIAIAKEKLGPFDFTGRDTWLDSHLQEFISFTNTSTFERILFSREGPLLKLLHLLICKEVMVASDPNIEVWKP